MLIANLLELIMWASCDMYASTILLASERDVFLAQLRIVLFSRFCNDDAAVLIISIIIITLRSRTD